MSIASHFTALVAEMFSRLKRRVLRLRVRARHPTLICDPTAIWDYGFHDIDAIEIGTGVTVGAFTEILVQRQSARSNVEGRLILGDRSVIGTGANIRAAGGIISLGSDSGFAQNTVAVAANHAITNGVMFLRASWDESRTGVLVGRNVWVGANCVLLPGTRIGDNTVIAAGSVVRGEVPSGELWGGVPARRIKNL